MSGKSLAQQTNDSDVRYDDDHSGFKFNPMTSDATLSQLSINHCEIMGVGVWLRMAVPSAYIQVFEIAFQQY